MALTAHGRLLAHVDWFRIAESFDPDQTSLDLYLAVPQCHDSFIKAGDHDGCADAAECFIDWSASSRMSVFPVPCLRRDEQNSGSFLCRRPKACVWTVAGKIIPSRTAELSSRRN